MVIHSIRRSHLLAGAGMLLAGVTISARASSLAHSSSPAPATTAPAATQIQGLTPDVDHGRYIVHGIAMCVECHSPRDEQGNLNQSQEFEGGAVPVRPPWANDWALVAPRIKGLPGYDDAQAMRLLTEGAIGRGGVQLRPPMPRFHMEKQDAADVIAYMRSLK
jgi:mono/diheme cytochrome c family protein